MNNNDSLVFEVQRNKDLLSTLFSCLNQFFTSHGNEACSPTIPFLLKG